MSFESIINKFNKLSNKSVILEDETGAKLEFLKDKYVSHITKYIEKEYQHLPLDQVFKNDEYGKGFFKKLSEKLGKECFSTEYKSYKSYYRIENVLCGKCVAKDEKEMKRCLHFVKDLEHFFDITLLVNPEEVTYTKNMYLNSLVFPLLKLMVDTDFYYYIPKSKKSAGYICYRNQLKMIEANIDALYGDSNKTMLDLWLEIINPLYNIVGDSEENPGGDYPGITSKLWFDANPNLKFFDCVYEIAQKDYETYEKIVLGTHRNLHFAFDIGKSREEVKNNICIRNRFISKEIRDNFEAEKKLFYTELITAYKYIMKKYMYIDIE